MTDFDEIQNSINEQLFAKLCDIINAETKTAGESTSTLTYTLASCIAANSETPQEAAAVALRYCSFIINAAEQLWAAQHATSDSVN